MPPKLTLLLGGARSGKSTLAVQWAQQRARQVVFIATAQPSDDEMARRIARHRAERPAHWQTLEIPRGVGAALRRQPPQAEVCILDCVTLLVSNVLLAGTNPDAPDADRAQQTVAAEIHSLLEAIAASSCAWLVVSNEVGAGLVPPYPLGRLFRDLLGWANRTLAAQADEVYYLIAGIPVPLHLFRGALPDGKSSTSPSHRGETSQQ